MTARSQRQRGQALVEMAIIAPVLILLVFGALYVSYAFMQRSLMNGVAFMAARATAVRPESQAQEFAEHARARMVSLAKLNDRHWLSQAKIEPEGGARQGRITLTAPQGKLWALVAHLAAITAGGGDQTSITIDMAPEYVAFGKASGRPPTGSVIDYAVTETERYEKAIMMSGNAFVRLILPLVVDVPRAKDARIYEPDRRERANRPEAGTGLRPVGNIDNQLGADIRLNRYHLERQKVALGLESDRPEGHGIAAPKVRKDGQGTMNTLQSMSRGFDEMKAATGAVNLVADKLLTGPLGKLAQSLITTGAGVVIDGADVILQTQARFLETHQRSVLQP